MAHLDPDPNCEHCGGTGVVTVHETVWAGEPHTAPVGEKRCICTIPEFSDDRLED